MSADELVQVRFLTTVVGVPLPAYADERGQPVPGEREGTYREGQCAKVTPGVALAMTRKGYTALMDDVSREAVQRDPVAKAAGMVGHASKLLAM